MGSLLHHRRMMKVFRSSDAVAGSFDSCALAIGNFDGVHLGHQALIERTIDLARASEIAPVALTFDPHPIRFFRPDTAPPLISSEAQKLALLSRYGIEAVVIEAFDRQLASLSPAQFVEQRLVSRLKARHVIIGDSFMFGRGRAGSVGTMAAEGSRHGFEVHGLPMVQVGGEPVSSSRIRHCISSGDVRDASQLLGRPFTLDGHVVSGAGRGRTIGVPTANLEPQDRLIPARGVYATRAIIDDGRGHTAVTNVGYAPTFEQEQRIRIETHVLDFEGDLLDKRLQVSFLARIRGEKRFAGADDLVRQIAHDIERTRQIVAEHG
jgi:riboflavin kinase/FMN adenylyltransferase